MSRKVCKRSSVFKYGWRAEGGEWAGGEIARGGCPPPPALFFGVVYLKGTILVDSVEVRESL